MAWSNEEISDFQIMNNKALAEINATLRPNEKLMRGKVGIFAFGQAGDLATCMSVLKYQDEIFPDKQIIWFANSPNADMLRYAPIAQVRQWPWAGNGLPNGTPDYWPMLCNENNRLNLDLAKNYEGTADLEDGFFPCPFMLPVEKRHGWDYAVCSKKVFGIPDNYEWHPVINHSDEEKIKAMAFLEKLPKTKIVLFETFAGSDQSRITHDMVIESIRICKEKWKGCSIVFVSHKYLKSQEQFPEGFFEQEGIYSAAHFSVRQCALLTHYSHLMISVSSGVTVACSAWNMNPIPIAQFCGSKICSTAALALGRFELITYDDKTFENAKNEFYEKLKLLLNERNT